MNHPVVEPVTVYGLFATAMASLTLAGINAALTTVALILTIVYTTMKLRNKDTKDD